jgi:predicted Rossmann fold nucleotide-binding protein DprA/Smf involved in DNA uptake
MVISGLALGVDAIAYRAALEADGLTLAILPGPSEVILTSSHQNLAEENYQAGRGTGQRVPQGQRAVQDKFCGTQSDRGRP